MEMLKSPIYQLKITLIDSNPLIWRRILISPNDTFEDLHGAIQDAMGWENAHLHDFCLSFADKQKRIVMTEEDMSDSAVILEFEAVLNDYLPNCKKVIYTYDFGDSWEHEIKLEKIIEKDKNIKNYPICIVGARACPPEDCGGIWSYMDMLEVIKDPSCDNYEETIEWLGDDFDPEKFEL